PCAAARAGGAAFRYFAGSAANLALHPALQNRYSRPSCTYRCGESGFTVIPQTGSRSVACCCGACSCGAAVLIGSTQLDVAEYQVRGRIVAVGAVQIRWHRGEAHHRADAGGAVLAPPEIVPIAAGELADVEDSPCKRLTLFEQLVFLRVFGPTEHMMDVVELRCGFGRQRVENVAGLVVVAAPGQRHRPASGLRVMRVDRGGRGAVGVHFGLELLGAVQASVAQLKRP